MAETYYLWSPVNTEINEFGRVMATAKVGEKVTADKLGMSKEDFQDLVDAGAIRTDPYPDIEDDVAPSEHFRAMGVAPSDDLSKDERKELEAFRAAEAKAAANKPVV